MRPGVDTGAAGARWQTTRRRWAAACLAVAATACQETAERPADLAVATFWVGRGAETLNQELLRIGHALGPVSLDLRFFSPTGLADQLLRSGLAREQGTLDLVIVPNDWLGQLFERDLISELPLTRVEALQQHLVRQALLAVSDRDRVLAYPLSAEVPALVYDPLRFTAPPRSMEDILAAPLPPGVIPFSLSVLTPSHLIPLVSSFQGSLLDRDGNLLWRDDALIEVLTRLAPVWRHPGAWQVCRADDPESLQLQLFSEGKLASFVAGPWLLEALEATGRPFAAMPVPPFAESPHPARAVVGYQCIAVLRESHWIDLALDAGARLLEDEANERINRDTRRLPVLLSSYQSKQALTAPGVLGFLRALEEGEGVPPSANWSQGVRRIGDRLQRLRAFSQPPPPSELAAVLRGGAS